MQERQKVSQRIAELKQTQTTVIAGIKKLAEAESSIRAAKLQTIKPETGIIEVRSTPQWVPPSREELLRWKKDNRSAIRYLGQTK